MIGAIYTCISVVGVFSLEMRRDEFGLNLGSVEAGVTPRRPGRIRRHRPTRRSGRLCSALGLRDGALRALVAAGPGAVEIAALKSSAVTLHGDRVVVSVCRHGVTWCAALAIDLRACWPGSPSALLRADTVPVFRGVRGPLTSDSIRKVLDRRTRRRSK